MRKSKKLKQKEKDGNTKSSKYNDEKKNNRKVTNSR